MPKNNRKQGTFYSQVRDTAEGILDNHPKLEMNILRSGIEEIPEDYLTVWILAVLLSGMIGLALSAVIIIALIFTMPEIGAMAFILLFLAVGVAPGVSTYLYYLFKLKKSKRDEKSQERSYGFESFSMKLFGNYARKSISRYPALPSKLVKIRLDIRPEVYIAKWFTSVLIASAAGILFSAFVIFLIAQIPDIANLQMIGIFIIVFFGLFPSVITYAYYISFPSSRLSTLQAGIDKELPSATNFMSALTASNVNIIKIFAILSRKNIYGELSKEAAFIVRDVEIFKEDTITALKRAISRSPSKKFRDFLQGLITTILSGNAIKDYLMDRSKQYSTESRIELKDKMEKMDILAETFVVVAIAGPLFLFIIALIMSLVDAQATSSSMALLKMVVLLLMPASLFGFILLFKSSRDN